MLSASHNEEVRVFEGAFVHGQETNSNAADIIISLEEIRQAARRIEPYIKRTPTLIDTFPP